MLAAVENGTVTLIGATTDIMQYGYRIVEDMKDGLARYMEKEGVDHLEDLVGLANKNIIPAEEHHSS